MKQLIRLMFVPISLCACAGTSYAWPPPLMSGTCDELCEQVRDGSRVISRTTSTNDLISGCSAHFFERDDIAGYSYFLTVAHCVGRDNPMTGLAEAAFHRVYLFPYVEDPDEERNLDDSYARVIAVGKQSENDDFAVLRVKNTNMNGSRPHVFAFTSTRAETGEVFAAFSSPGGAGLQFLPGMVSKAKHGLPLEDMRQTINWKDGMFIQIHGAGPGSSGTVLVSAKRRVIIGILVGAFGPANAHVALPSDRFLRFWKAVQNGTYLWFKMDPVATP